MYMYNVNKNLSQCTVRIKNEWTEYAKIIVEKNEINIYTFLQFEKVPQRTVVWFHGSGQFGCKTQTDKYKIYW